ncbi:MAG: squalene--hopene cyclase [Candidatus Hydrogenedentota bacterium]
MTQDLENSPAGVDCSAGLTRVDKAIDRACHKLFSLQSGDGYWVGELFADSTLASDSIILHSFMESDPIPHVDMMRRHILSKQLPDGGWNQYPGGQAEINATLKAYLALKLSGVAASDPTLVRARAAIAGLGGLRGLHTYCRFYLATLGQVPWSEAPEIPPELFLAPRWFPVNFHAFSAWSRGIIASMTIMRSLEPVVKPPEERGARELIEEFWAEKPAPTTFAGRFFVQADRAMRAYGRMSFNPLRRYALRRAEDWMMNHLSDGGLGAIYPAIQNAAMALKTLGYGLDHPLVKAQLDEIEKFNVIESGEIRVQPCNSPVWDTVWSVTALAESGYSTAHPALKKAAHWLIDRKLPQHARNFDRARAGSEPARGMKRSAWCFQFSNPFFPDVDDTIGVMTALHVSGAEKDAELGESARKAVDEGARWILDMRNRDGGWASFDKDLDNGLLEAIPFADHNAILDPSTADITARVLEHLRVCERPLSKKESGRAIAFLLDEQEKNGSWFGRWGVNYIYGTSAALVALSPEAQGDRRVAEAMRRGAAWFRAHQNPDGGWGESCRSYDESGIFQREESTPSQTAWALIGLMATGDGSGAGAETAESIERGIARLLATQDEDGTWDELNFTGTGFPKVFYLGYSMYSHYFPLIALSRYRRRRRD